MSAAAGQRWLRLGSVLGFLGVGLGAFGAHALKSRLSPDLLAVFETATGGELRTFTVPPTVASAG